MSKVTKEEKRYILNADVAKQVANRLFPDCKLVAFDPSWRFSIPKFIPSNERSFDIPDFVMGLLAEKLGLDWRWEKHPSEYKADYEKYQQWQKDQEEYFKEWQQAIYKGDE